jgi:hypothetical protein
MLFTSNKCFWALYGSYLHSFAFFYFALFSVCAMVNPMIHYTWLICKDDSGRIHESATPQLTCHMHSNEGVKLDRSEFSRTTLSNAKRHVFHCCSKCEDRRNHLQGKLRGTKIKCDCPGGLHQAAREKCAVFHHRLSQKWPGKDCGRGREAVTWDDVKFLNRLPTHPVYSWWHKLWGRLCKRSS